MDDPRARARALIDAAHEQDPEQVDGRAAELTYADRVETWVRRLVPDADDALLLAARCQHLERWAIPRDRFPLDRAGYHRWRTTVHRRQGERARALLLDAGCPAELATRVGELVAKAVPRTDPAAQTLEDAACLVFLEHELPGFAAEHPDYPREKWLEILRRTWAKMGDAGRAAALALPLREDLRALVIAAVG